MTIIAVVIALALLGIALQRSATIRNWISGILWGSVGYTLAGVLTVVDYTRQFIRALVITSIVYLALLVIALATGYSPFILAVLALGVILAFTSMYTLHLVRLPVREIAAQLHRLERFLKSPPLTFSLSADFDPAKAKGWKAVVGILGGLVLAILNGPYLLAVAPILALGGAVGILGDLADTSEKIMGGLARRLAWITMILLSLACMGLVDMELGTHALNPWSFTILSIIGLIIVIYQVFDEPTEAVHGVPVGLVAMGGLVLATLVAMLWVSIQPEKAHELRTIVRQWQAGDLKNAKIARHAGEKTPDIYVVARKKIDIQYIRTVVVHPTTGEERVFWKTGLGPVEENTIGVRKDPDEPAETRGTRRPMVQVFWADPSDPDLVLVDTNRNPDTAMWVPLEYLEDVPTFPGAPAKKEHRSGFYWLSWAGFWPLLLAPVGFFFWWRKHHNKSAAAGAGSAPASGNGAHGGEIIYLIVGIVALVVIVPAVLATIMQMFVITTATRAGSGALLNPTPPDEAFRLIAPYLMVGALVAGIALLFTPKKTVAALLIALAFVTYVATNHLASTLPILDPHDYWNGPGRPAPRSAITTPTPSVLTASASTYLPPRTRPLNPTFAPGGPIPPALAPSTPSAQFAENLRLLDEELANYPHLGRNRVLALIQVESAWNPRAKSPKGAQGLMQLMPDTVDFVSYKLLKRTTRLDPLDPRENIQGGLAYLNYLHNRFGGQLIPILVGYNWGPDHVDKWQAGGKTESQLVASSPLETKVYVTRITRLVEKVGETEPTQSVMASEVAAHSAQPANGPDGHIKSEAKKVNGGWQLVAVAKEHNRYDNVVLDPGRYTLEIDGEVMWDPAMKPVKPDDKGLDPNYTDTVGGRFLSYKVRAGKPLILTNRGYIEKEGSRIDLVVDSPLTILGVDVNNRPMSLSQNRGHWHINIQPQS